MSTRPAVPKGAKAPSGGSVTAQPCSVGALSGTRPAVPKGAKAPSGGGGACAAAQRGGAL